MIEVLRGPGISPDCAHCPCAVDGQPVRPIRGVGKVGSLAIVGEGPAASEVSQGYPFVGESGKLLQMVLSAAGIDRYSIWITNALLCQRPHDKQKLSVAIECCRPRLQHELSLVAPRTVCALGNSAARALALPVTAITDARGTVQHSPLVSFPVITTIHPAAILRGGAGEVKGGGKQKMNVDAQTIFLQADIAKAYAHATTGVEEWRDDIALLTEDNYDNRLIVYRVLDAAVLSGLLAIDLEWNKAHEITWLGLASHDKARSSTYNAVSIYWPHMPREFRMVIADYGMEEKLPKLFHNLQADIGVWEAQIGPIRGAIEDTMLMHHAAFPGAAHDLQQVTSQLLLVPPWKASRANEEKVAVKAKAALERAQRKSLKQLEHEARNAESKAAAQTRKRARVSKHEAQNQTAALLKLLEGK